MKFVRVFSKFQPRAKGADFDERTAPAGERGDFGDGAFLEVEERDDESILGREGVEKFADDFASAECVVRCGRGLLAGEEFEPVALGFAEVGVTPLRASLFRAERIEAGGDGEARKPVLERDAVAPAILVEPMKHFDEDFLREVFLRRAARPVGADDFDDERIEVLDEFARRGFVAEPHALEERRDVGSFKRHECIASLVVTARTSPRLRQSAAMILRSEGVRLRRGLRNTCGVHFTKTRSETVNHKLKKGLEKACIDGAQKHLFLCIGPDCCKTREGEALWDFVKERVKESGAKVMRTKAGCFRICTAGPWLVVYPDGTWYDRVTPERFERILQEHVIGGQPVREWVVVRNDFGCCPQPD